MNFGEAIDLCVRRNLSFAAWKSPTAGEAYLLISHKASTSLFDLQHTLLNQRGFLFHPFSTAEASPVFLRADILFRESHGFEEGDFPAGREVCGQEELFYQASQEEYETQVQAIVEQIRLGTLSKAVLSRVLLSPRPPSLAMGTLFQRMVHRYPGAFVYVVQTPTQLWCGASPEPFLLADNGRYITTAIAGTRSSHASCQALSDWSDKERREQEFVSDHISDCFGRHTAAPYEVVGPAPYVAGNLYHLKTTFSIAEQHLNDRLASFIRDLHPTPAVCGLPTPKALSLLMALEKHSRKYYAGFLGPVHIGTPLSLYVNLRCMQVMPRELALFMGAGIMADSLPRQEWNETVLKSETMMAIVRSFYEENP
ncbi:MAG: hypothetical protein CSA95_00890 [Bacteroidetes bacterium]|nr:MAG: hypothetical protein CSA95_00890 [Bacteroidota bacterium]